MRRKRLSGLCERAGFSKIEKQIFGRKIHKGAGTDDMKNAEKIMARRLKEDRQAKVFGVRSRRTLREVATRVLEEKLELKYIGHYAEG